MEQATDRPEQGSLTGADGWRHVAPAGLATIDGQLDRLRSQLAELSSRYTDSIPMCKRLKDQIAKTEAIRDRTSWRPRRRKSANAKQRPDAGDRRIRPERAGHQLQSQLQANQLEITNRENAIASLKARIGGYEGRLNLSQGPRSSWPT